VRDVIVIGAGGGGPVIAKELAGRGLDVLVLEAGPHHDDPETQWSRYENDATNPVTGYLRFGPGDRSKPAWFRETPQSSVVLQVAGVGGTTLHYFANCPRAMPGAFMGYDGRDRDAYDTAHPVPFTYRELIPYYEWVEHTLPVRTAAMGTKEAVFFRGAEAIGLPLNRSKDVTRDSFRPQENAILQPKGTAGRTRHSRKLLYPRAEGCTFCGTCIQGCVQPRRAPRNLKAKRSTDNSYVPMALTADRWSPGGRPVEVRPDAFVTQIGTEATGSRTVARGVRWRDVRSGDVFEEDARVVVMAAGAVEDPRLWLNSGLPDPNGWVGRGFTNHFLDFFFARLDEYTGTSKGAGSAARADFPGRGMLEHVGGTGPALLAGNAVLSDSGIRGYYTRGGETTGAWDGPAGRILGPQLKELFADVDRVFVVASVTDDDVEPHNRVLRSALPADEHGPIPRVEFPRGRRSARTVANREFLAGKAAELMRAAGAKEVCRMDDPPLMLHVHSTMRMGHDPSDSVVDPTGEARFVERLYIASNSSLPNGLGGPNPTLTTQAIATRTAERLFQTYFGGDPWVTREAPVCSTDERVTEGVLDGAYDL
jgi:choline dehydrogenase-like flavoprotein